MTMTLSIFSLFLLVIVLMLANAWTAFGKSADDARKERIESSALYQDGKFRNQLPLRNFFWRTVRDAFTSGQHQMPGDPIEIFNNDGGIYASKPSSGLRITWLGHSTLLVELDETTLLIDPVWGPRASPFSWVGLKRWYESPLALDELPDIDAVLISHDHYDHLDEYTVKQLAESVPMFVTPLGVGSHLAYWGIAESAITELAWWEKIDIKGTQITATPARHASGRHLLDQGKTLWAGFSLKGSQSIYYSGDTGLFPGFKEIGERLGPFDMTMIEVGAYNRNWPDWHLGPEQAVLAHQWVKGKRFLPLHWGLFNLAQHNWTEPMERVLYASERLNLPVLTPQPGLPFEPGITDLKKWWPDLPWQGADEHTIMSTRLETLETHEIRLINGD